MFGLFVVTYLQFAYAFAGSIAGRRDDDTDTVAHDALMKAASCVIPPNGLSPMQYLKSRIRYGIKELVTARYKQTQRFTALPEDIEEQEAQAFGIVEIIDSLPHDIAITARNRWLNRMSLKELAKYHSISTGAVSVRLQAAKELIADRL